MGSSLLDGLGTIVIIALYICLVIATCQLAAKDGKKHYFFKFFLPYISTGLLVLFFAPCWIIYGRPAFFLNTVILGLFLLYLPVALGAWRYVLPAMAESNKKNR